MTTTDTWAEVENNWKTKAKERLAKQEEQAEAKRDEHEEAVEKIIGRSLTSAEIYNLRHHFRQIEEFENDLEKIAERFDSYE